MTIQLSQEAQEALKACLVTKGKNKGALLKQAPPMATLAYAAWQGAMINANPYKASIAGLMFLSPEQWLIYNEINALFEAMPSLRFLDRDRAALEKLGVW